MVCTKKAHFIATDHRHTRLQRSLWLSAFCAELSFAHDPVARACASGENSPQNTVFHAKRVDCAIFHLLVNILGILRARPTYDISSRSPIFGDHFDTNDKVSHDSHVTQLAEEVTMF